MRNYKMLQMRLVLTILSGWTACLAQAVEICDPEKNEKAEQGYVCQVDTKTGPALWSLEVKTAKGKMVWKDQKSGLLVSDEFWGEHTQYDAEKLCQSPQMLPPEFDPRGTLSPSIKWKLPSGYSDSFRGRYGFPLDESDWDKLAANGILLVLNGFVDKPLSGPGGIALPNMKYFFWSSSIVPDYFDSAFFFSGKNNAIRAGNRNAFKDSKLRCVGQSG